MTDEQPQVEAALAVVTAVIGRQSLLGVYLTGSAVDGGLHPDSDLDLFVVTDASLAPATRRRLIEGLMPISGRATRPPGWRPLEVTVVVADAIRPWRYPPLLDLQYGEWHREAYERGEREPTPVESPDLGVLVTMVRSSGRRLIGPAPEALLDPVPRQDLERAMRDEIPSLLDDLASDTRNVLLTLARMWRTAATGEIVAKDVAAEWATERLPPKLGPPLARARDLYRSGGYGEWPDLGPVRATADAIIAKISG